MSFVADRGRIAAAFIPAVLIVLYAFWAADPSGIVTGPPWRATGGVLLGATLIVAVWRWFAPGPPRRQTFVTIVLLCAVLARVVVSTALLRQGWSAIVETVDGNVSTVQSRLGSRTPDGGTVDSAVEVSDQSSALQFLNDARLSPGGPDPVRPVSLRFRWAGYVWMSNGAELVLRQGDPSAIDVAIDAAHVSLSAGKRVEVRSGNHQLSVTYTKPAGSATQLSLAVLDSSGRSVSVFAEMPTAQGVARHFAAHRILVALDVIFIVSALVWAWPYGAGLNRAWFPSVLLIVIPVALFTIQGLIAAGHASHLTIFLIGDDMRQYASQGRDVFLHGLLMNDGKRLFTGEPFFFYPLYPYFVALSHRLFDESFYGLVLLQFVLLGALAVMLARLTSAMFGQSAGFIALALVLGLAELDFVRYYTNSVFTDNLYYPLVVAAVAFTWKAAAIGSRTDALVAGAIGGAATLTRPSMMPALPLIVLWWIWRRADRPDRDTMKVAGLFSGSWMAVVGLATFRNWLVSGRFVLLAESSLQILYFLAPRGVAFEHYMSAPRPSVPQTLAGAWRLFLDYPAGVLAIEARKLAFMAGFTNVVQGVRMHPEFLIVTLGYVCWSATAGRRRSGTAALHLTLLAHVIAFLLAAPWTYGYKTMLTLMLLMVPFTSDWVARSVERLHSVVVQKAPRLVVAGQAR